MHDSANEGDPIVLNDPNVQFEGDVNLCVKGRLHSNLQYWESVLEAPAPILDIIRQGYTLPFLSVPKGKCFKNQRSAFLHSSFVSESVRDLLTNGCIAQVESEPLVCSPLLVVSNSSGKKRLVTNLSYVNMFLNLSMKT